MKCKKEKCVWELSEDDLYCSWCGLCQANFTVSLSAARVYVREIPPPVYLTVLNNTGGSIYVRDVEIVSSDPQLRVQVQTPMGLEVGNGRDEKIQIDVHATSLAERNHHVTLRVVTNVGSQPVRLEVVPRPEISLQVGEHSLFLDSEQSREIQDYIVITKGVMTIESVTSIDCALPGVTIRVPEHIEFPVNLGPPQYEAKLPVIFEFAQQTFLASNPSLPFEVAGQIKVAYKDSEHPRPAQFKVECANSPYLTIEPREKGRIQVLDGQSKDITLRIKNSHPTDKSTDSSRGVLEIRKVEVKNSDGTLCSWAQPIEPVNSVLCIAGGQSVDLSFELQTKNIRGKNRVGNHYIEVSLITNTLEREISQFIDIDIKSINKKPGILVIDFGTSTTCALLLTESGLMMMKDLIPIDETFVPQEGRHPGLAPSVIQYQAVKDKTKQYKVGSRQYQIGSLPAEFAHTGILSIVTSPKRLLGVKEKRVVETGNGGKTTRSKIDPWTVTADYLYRVKERAQLHASALIKNFIIAHPSRFSQEHLGDLEKAARKAFGLHQNQPVEKIAEPIAAALDFIVRKESIQRGNYTLMVYDFGGGTTDITLLDIKTEMRAQKPLVTPELLSADGDNMLGGNEVTEIVMRLGIENLEKNQSIKVILSDDTEQTENHSQRVAVAGANRGILLRWAEATKIGLSTLGKDYKPLSSDTVSLTVFNETKDIVTKEYPYDILKPTLEQFEEEVESLLQRGISKMRTMVNDLEMADPAVILLVGKSSALPLVKKMIAKEFESAEIQMSKNLDYLKECVVRGVCVRELSKQGAYPVRLNLSEAILAATTSRIGYLSYEIIENEGRTKFNSIFGAGVPIPEIGLKKRINLSLHRGDFYLYEDKAGDLKYINDPTSYNMLGPLHLSNIPAEIDDDKLSNSTLEVKIDKNQSISVDLIIEGRSEPVPLGIVKTIRKGNDGY